MLNPWYVLLHHDTPCNIHVAPRPGCQIQILCSCSSPFFISSTKLLYLIHILDSWLSTYLYLDFYLCSMTKLKEHSREIGQDRQNLYRNFVTSSIVSPLTSVWSLIFQIDSWYRIKLLQIARPDLILASETWWEKTSALLDTNPEYVKKVIADDMYLFPVNTFWKKRASILKRISCCRVPSVPIKYYQKESNSNAILWIFNH